MPSLYQWTAFLVSNADLCGIEASHVAESRAPSRSACSEADALDDGGPDGTNRSRNNLAGAGLNFLIDQPGALAIVG